MSAPVQQTAGQQIPELAGYQRRLLIGSAAGFGLSLVGLAVKPAQFFQSYLAAYMLALGATMGCLALAMIHHLTGGGWGVLVRRFMGAASRTLPVLTVMFLPIVFGMHLLYPWTHLDIVAKDEILQAKRLYLNTPFFLVRAAAYFLIWNAISYFLNAWSLEQDRTADPLLALKMERLSAGGLLIYVLTMTFAAIDWLMSLEPHWFSTIYGVVIVGGQGLTAIAVVILALAWLTRFPPLESVTTPQHFHDLANLMLTFVMLWAYFSFSQYLIIWSGNLPEEIAWYLNRLQAGWRLIGVALILFHFFVPFLLLLSRTIKRDAGLIVKVSMAILVARAIELFWLTAPEFHQHGIAVSWLDLLLPVSFAALWAGCFIWQLRGHSILPVHDPEFDEAIAPLIERTEQ